MNVTQDVLDSRQHVKFEVCTPPGSNAELALATRIIAPPLRLAEPSVVLEVGGGCRSFTVCSPRLELGQVWLGIFAEGFCSAYNVTATGLVPSSDDEDGGCSVELGDVLDTSSSVQELLLERVRRETCQPHSWIDFRVKLTPEDKRQNIVFEVKDLSDQVNPTSLSVATITLFLSPPWPGLRNPSHRHRHP